MTAPDPNHHPVVAVLREVGSALQRLRVDLAHHYPVTVADTSVLSELAAARGQQLRPRDIGPRIGVGSGTLSAMLDRLEAAGLITRGPNPHDRRSSLVRLEPAGRAALAISTTQLAAAIDTALSPDEQQAVARSLRLVVAAVEAAAESGRQPPTRAEDPSTRSR